MNKYWSDEEFIETVKNSYSISVVLNKFGLPGNQGWYNKLFHAEIKRLNIDINHFRASSNGGNFFYNTY